jgi:hypothetical protein
VPVNLYFNNFPNDQVTSEQLLVEDLVIEAMQMHGMDVYYMPRSSGDSVDMLYGEDTLKRYTVAHSIEMYLENVTGMDGEGDFMSKFGLEIRDELSLLVSRKRFKYTTGASNLIRPREGDLVYIPLIQNFFEITFVEEENNQAMFYTLGRGRGGNVYVYALKLKQFVFSEEIISTGVDEIDDQIFDSYKRASLPIANTTVFPAGTGSFVPGEIIYQGSSLATANAQAIVYSYTAHSSVDIIQVQGTFVTGNVRGNTSNAFRSAISYNDDTQVGNNLFEDIADNVRIETEADGILDFTEHNPFGEA